MTMIGPTAGPLGVDGQPVVAGDQHLRVGEPTTGTGQAE